MGSIILVGATPTKAGVMTAPDKTKLDSLPSVDKLYNTYNIFIKVNWDSVSNTKQATPGKAPISSIIYKGNEVISTADFENIYRNFNPNEGNFDVNIYFSSNDVKWIKGIVRGFGYNGDFGINGFAVRILNAGIKGLMDNTA